MDYLTNYYKNLSEKLQHKVNALETRVKYIKEASSSYYDEYGNFSGGGVGGGMGSGTSTRDFSPETGRNESPSSVDNVLNNWGPYSGYGDLNGDGRVDGADLGLALGGGNSFKSRQTGGVISGGSNDIPTRDTRPIKGGVKDRPTQGSGPKGPVDIGMPSTSAGGYQTDRPGPKGPVDVRMPGIGAGGYSTDRPGPKGPVDVQMPGIGAGGYSTETPGGRGTGTRNTSGSNQGENSNGNLGDLNGDGRIDGADLGLYLARFGQAPSNLKYSRTGQVMGTSYYNPPYRRNPYSGQENS